MVIFTQRRFTVWLSCLLLSTVFLPFQLFAQESVQELDPFASISKQELARKINSLDGRIKYIPCTKPQQSMERLIGLGDHYIALFLKRDKLYGDEIKRQEELLKQFLVVTDQKNGLIPGIFAQRYYQLLAKGTRLGVFRDPATIKGALPRLFQEAEMDLSQIATHGRDYIDSTTSWTEAKQAEQAKAWMDKVFLKEGQAGSWQIVDALNKEYEQLLKDWKKARKEYIELISTTVTDAQKAIEKLADEQIKLVKLYEDRRTELRVMAGERNKTGDPLYEHCIGKLTVAFSFASAVIDSPQLEWLDQRAALFYEVTPEGSTEALPGMGYHFLTPTKYRWSKPSMRAKDAKDAKAQISEEFPLNLPLFKLNTEKYVSHYSSVLEAKERLEHEANRAVGLEVARIAMSWTGLLGVNATGEDIKKVMAATLGEGFTDSMLEGLGVTNYTLYTMGNATATFTKDTLTPIGEALDGVAYILKGDGDVLTITERLKALGVIIGDNAQKMPKDLGNVGLAVLEKGVQVIANTTKTIGYSARRAVTDCSELTGKQLIFCRESRLEASREVRKASKQLIEDTTKLSLLVAMSKITTPTDKLAESMATKLSQARKAITKKFRAIRHNNALQKARKLAKEIKTEKLESTIDKLYNKIQKTDDLQVKIDSNKTSSQSDWDKSHSRAELTDNSKWQRPGGDNSGGFNQYKKEGDYGYKRTKDPVPYSDDNPALHGQLADEYGNKIINELDSPDVGISKVHDQFVEVKIKAYQVDYIENGKVKTAYYPSQKSMDSGIKSMRSNGGVPTKTKIIERAETYDSMESALQSAKKLKETGWNSTVQQFQVVDHVPAKFHGTQLQDDMLKVKQFDDPNVPSADKIDIVQYNELKKSIKGKLLADEKAARILDQNNIIHLDDTWGNKAYIPKDGGGYKLSFIDSGGAFKVIKPLPGCTLEQTTNIFRKSLRDSMSTLSHDNMALLPRMRNAENAFNKGVNRYLKQLNGKNVSHISLLTFDDYLNAKKIGFKVGEQLPMKFGDHYTATNNISDSQLKYSNPNKYEKELLKTNKDIEKISDNINDIAAKAEAGKNAAFLKKNKKQGLSGTQPNQKSLNAGLLLALQRSKCSDVRNRYLSGEKSSDLKKSFIECQKFFQQQAAAQ